MPGRKKTLRGSCLRKFGGEKGTQVQLRRCGIMIRAKEIGSLFL